MKNLRYEERAKLRNILEVFIGDTIFDIDNAIASMMINGEHKMDTIMDFINKTIKEQDLSERMKRKLRVYLVNESIATAKVLNLM